jgi:uncharacterized membrane protein
MSENIVNIIHKWLKLHNHKINRNDLSLQFLSHPDIGMINSISDTLDQFQIPCQVAKIDTASISYLETPFIAVVQQDKIQNYILVLSICGNLFQIYTENNETLSLTYSEFTRIYKGYAIAINSEQSKIKKYSLLKHIILFSVFILSFIITFFLQNNFERISFLHKNLSLIGLGLSILLFVQSTGNNSGVLNRLCEKFDGNSCSKVLKSKAASINRYVSLIDLGIIYFSVQFLSQVIFLGINSFTYLLSFTASFFSLYSIYQQAFVIKIWCTLCLLVVMILILQGAVSFVEINNSSFDYFDFISFISLSLLIIYTWFYIRKLIQGSQFSKQKEINLLSFKRNYRLFIPFFKSQFPLDDTPLQKYSHFIIGNPNARVVITIIANPLCAYCKSALSTTLKLQEIYPEEVSIRVLFNVPYRDSNNITTKLALFFLSSFHLNRESGIKALTDWYNSFADSNYFENYSLSNLDDERQLELLKISNEWCLCNSLTVTPLLLINNKVLPVIYSPEDLFYLIDEIIEEAKSEKLSLQTNNIVQLIN